MPSRFRVPLGYLAGFVVLAVAHADSSSLILGLALALPGEALRVWASGHIEKTRFLATGGPYAHSRNPLYLGSLFMGVGVAAAAASPWAVLALLAYAVACYPTVIREEESFLRQKFPEDYAQWSREVPSFVPRIAPRGPRASRFLWARVVANREWRTALALPLIGGMLYARGAFLP